MSRECRERILREYKGKEIIHPPKELKRLASLYSVLSSPIRLAILWLLMQMKMPVCLITAILNEDQTLISHHLRKLKDYEIIIEEVKGKFKYYSINPSMKKLVNQVLEIMNFLS